MRAALALMLSATLQLAAVSAVFAQSLPGLKRDLDFDAHMKSVDLEDPSLRFEYKKATTNGSSIGFYIGKGEAPANASFVPTNTSSIPEAEVVSYRLARFLGVSRNYYPVTYFTLGRTATAKFKDMVAGAREVWEDRALNRKMVLKELDANPDSILGIYRLKPKTKMYAVNSLGAEGQFNRSTVLGHAIRATHAMPDEEQMSLPGVKGGRDGYPNPPTERTIELARELSTIFVIDQLLGQWDRFWGNLEAAGDKRGRLKLVARDNGGATLDLWDDFETYNRWVSRYDRDMVERLTTLNAFLKGEAPQFSGFTSVAEWKIAAGFLSPLGYNAFRKKLGLLIEKRIPALIEEHGNYATFFPPKSPEVLKLDAEDSCEDD